MQGRLHDKELAVANNIHPGPELARNLAAGPLKQQVPPATPGQSLGGLWKCAEFGN